MDVYNPFAKYCPPSTLIDLLCHRSQHKSRHSAYTFLIDGEAEKVSITYGALDKKARALATHLKSMIREGERVLLLYPQGLEYIAAFWGCLYAKVVAIPLYPPRLKQRNLSRIQAIVNDANPLLALTTDRILSITKPLFAQVQELKDLQFLATDTIPEEMADSWRRPSATGNTLAFFQYTSGSTSTPKGVMVSHGNLLHNLASMHRMFNLNSESVFVNWTPFYHDMGLILGTLLSLYGGIPNISMSPVTFLQRPFRWLQAISSFRATCSCGSDFAYNLCFRKITQEQRTTLDLSSWTLAVNGAEPVRTETINGFVEAFSSCGFQREAFYPSYGLAEATLHVSGGCDAGLPGINTVNLDRAELENNHAVEVSPGAKNSKRFVGCGQTQRDQKTIIVHPELLIKCMPDQIGEIWVSGPSITQGYWNRPKETLQTFQAHLSDTGEGPFLRTGDLGFLRNGELFITGRLKDLIIIRGRNLYPQDIELTAERSHPALRLGGSAAFSVDIDGEEQVVVVQEVEYDKQVDVSALVGSIRQAVFEDYEVKLHAVALIRPGSLFKTSSGKIQRSACRDAFLAGSLDVWKAENHA